MKALDQPFLPNMIVKHTQHYTPREVTKINTITNKRKDAGVMIPTSYQCNLSLCLVQKVDVS